MGLELVPRTTFWLPILQEAGLINEALYPTGFCQQWLAWSPDAQCLHLLEAWRTCPKNRCQRMRRTRLIRRLTLQCVLQPSDKSILPGLAALGITENEKLNSWGKIVLSQHAHPSPTACPPWQIKDGCLFIAFPVDWKLLWELEAFLSPQAELSYRLDEFALRRASQRGDPQKLLEILQKGVGEPVPAEIRAGILGQPVLKATRGLVIEFSDPAELRQLRRSEPLRAYFERVLSPRHVLVEEQNTLRLLKLLERRGIHAFVSSPTQPEILAELGKVAGGRRGSRTHFSRTGLLEPMGESVPVLEFIQQCLRQQTAFDMLYSAPSAHLSLVGFDADRPEVHRITPLLIEERGGFTYVIAYSHTRRGQRTYRLDRMDVPGTNLNEV